MAPLSVFAITAQDVTPHCQTGLCITDTIRTNIDEELSAPSVMDLACAKDSSRFKDAADVFSEEVGEYAVTQITRWVPDFMASNLVSAILDFLGIDIPFLGSLCNVMGKFQEASECVGCRDFPDVFGASGPTGFSLDSLINGIGVGDCPKCDAQALQHTINAQESDIASLDPHTTQTGPGACTAPQESIFDPYGRDGKLSGKSGFCTNMACSHNGSGTCGRTAP